MLHFSGKPNTFQAVRQKAWRLSFCSKDNMIFFLVFVILLPSLRTQHLENSKNIII
jgi:hypothetical protein